MAFNDIQHAWKIPGLTPTQRLVLLALANHRNGNKDDDRYDQCNPGYTLLAKETGLSIGAVSGAITKLEKRIITLSARIGGLEARLNATDGNPDQTWTDGSPI